MTGFEENWNCDLVVQFWRDTGLVGGGGYSTEAMEAKAKEMAYHICVLNAFGIIITEV